MRVLFLAALFSWLSGKAAYLPSFILFKNTSKACVTMLLIRIAG